MPGIQRSTAFLVVMTILLMPAGWGLAQAAEWSAPLQSGGQVTVDPRTNHATVSRDGVTTQLWDGVHRLQDGSTITVRSGTVVPTAAILNARSMPDHPRQADIESWQGAPIDGSSPCERLVNRVCGKAQACSEYPACAPVRQLLATEQQERQSSGQPDVMTYASGQCQVADRDRAFFSTCAARKDSDAVRYPSDPVKAALPPSPSACNMLVEKVCGASGACAGEETCSASRQLMSMAKQQQVRNSFASVPQDNLAERQCREALTDEDFFKRCR